MTRAVSALRHAGDICGTVCSAMRDESTPCSESTEVTGSPHPAGLRGGREGPT